MVWLEDRKPAIRRVGNGGRRGIVLVDRPELLRQERRVDRLYQLHQRVATPMIASRCERRSSACSVSRRSFGRIFFLSVRLQKHTHAGIRANSQAKIASFWTATRSWRVLASVSLAKVVCWRIG